MPVIGIGVDVVGIARFAESLERTPALVGRLFTAAEAALPVESLAARFAAKEAVAKALGAPGGLAWDDAEVVKEDSGQPKLVLRGSVRARAEALGATSVHLSLSHDAGVATAMVIVESSDSSIDRA